MKIIFMGTPQAAVPSLERCLGDGHDVVAVYTQPDRPSGRGNKITFSPVKQCALAHGISVYQPTKIKTPDAIETFTAHGADIAVVVAYGRILPETFLNAYPRGAVNVHFSLLPKYRGAAPVNWAIVNGEKETGVTTMMMDTGLDTGDILMQQATLIGERETAPELMERLSLLGAELLSKTLADLNGIKPRPQEHEKATLAPIMKREDGLIDWTRSAADIANRVRGFQPFPTAFTHFRNAKVTLWSAIPADIIDVSASLPGEIIEAGMSDLRVLCGGSTMLKINELQIEGKRRMAVRDFVNGFKPLAAEAFGVK
jgi:methionyl-tRNA formyltransferase